MGSLPNSIIFLPILLLVLALIPLFSANENLVKTQCHHTETPQLCIQCIKSADPEAKHSTDQVGIAITITSCVRNYSEHLAGNMKELAFQSKDQKLKAVFENCSEGYTESLKDLANVVSNLKKKDFDEANRSVVLATGFQAKCLEQLVGKLPDTDSSVVYDMKAFEFLSEAVMRIVDRF